MTVGGPVPILRKEDLRWQHFTNVSGVLDFVVNLGDYLENLAMIRWAPHWYGSSLDHTTMAQQNFRMVCGIAACWVQQHRRGSFSRSRCLLVAREQRTHREPRPLFCSSQLPEQHHLRAQLPTVPSVRNDSQCCQGLGLRSTLVIVPCILERRRSFRHKSQLPKTRDRDKRKDKSKGRRGTSRRC